MPLLSIILISSLDVGSDFFVSMVKHTCSQYIFTIPAIFYTWLSISVRGLRDTQNIFSFEAGLRLSWARAWRCRSNLVSDDFIKCPLPPAFHREENGHDLSIRERKKADFCCSRRLENVGRKADSWWGGGSFNMFDVGSNWKLWRYSAPRRAQCAPARRLSPREPILMQILMMLISFT